jgi:hypothetical protein
MSNNDTKTTIMDVTVDPKKANVILGWLIRREAENVRTKARSDNQMITDIEKKIEEVAKCY